MKNAEAICEAIYPNRFRFANEQDLQATIAKVLNERGVEFQREVALSPFDRLDDHPRSAADRSRSRRRR